MPVDPVARIRDRRQRLETELKALRDEEQAQQERRAAIVGRAVLLEAQRDEGFRVQLLAILDRTVSRKRDRRLCELADARPARRDRGMPSPGAVAIS